MLVMIPITDAEGTTCTIPFTQCTIVTNLANDEDHDDSDGRHEHAYSDDTSMHIHVGKA